MIADSEMVRRRCRIVKGVSWGSITSSKWNSTVILGSHVDSYKCVLSESVYSPFSPTFELSPTMSSISPLVALARIISQGVQTLESVYAEKGLSFPSLDEPFQPSPLDLDPDVGNTTRLVVAAAYQIIATVTPPQETITHSSAAMLMSASLGVADEANIADVLKAAGQVRMVPCMRGNLTLISYLGLARE